MTVEKVPALRVSCENAEAPCPSALFVDEWLGEDLARAAARERAWDAPDPVDGEAPGPVLCPKHRVGAATVDVHAGS